MGGARGTARGFCMVQPNGQQVFPFSPKARYSEYSVFGGVWWCIAYVAGAELDFYESSLLVWFCCWSLCYAHAVVASYQVVVHGEVTGCCNQRRIFNAG